MENWPRHDMMYTMMDRLLQDQLDSIYRENLTSQAGDTGGKSGQAKDIMIRAAKWSQEEPQAGGGALKIEGFSKNVKPADHSLRISAKWMVRRDIQAIFGARMTSPDNRSHYWSHRGRRLQHVVWNGGALLDTKPLLQAQACMFLNTKKWSCIPVSSAPSKDEIYSGIQLCSAFCYSFIKCLDSDGISKTLSKNQSVFGILGVFWEDAFSPVMLVTAWVYVFIFTDNDGTLPLTSTKGGPTLSKCTSIRMLHKYRNWNIWVVDNPGRVAVSVSEERTLIFANFPF